MSQTGLAVRRGEVLSRRGGSMQDEGKDNPALPGEGVQSARWARVIQASERGTCRI